MSTAETITAPAHSIDDPLRVAARQANQLWRGLRDAYIESAAAGEQAVLEGLLESAVAIEHRLYRLAACPVLHPRASPQPWPLRATLGAESGGAGLTPHPR
jgi:hypothetical protein